MAVDTVTAPELTAEQVQRILVAPLEAASIFLANGVRVFDTNGSPVRIPKMGGPITDPGWTGENTIIPERDVTFDEVELLPSSMKSVKVITRFSNELARQSVVALDAVLRARLVTDVATKMDNAFISGTGGTPAGTEPLGLLAYPGTQEIIGVGAVTLDDLHDAHGLLLAADVNMAAVRWMVRPQTFTALRKIKDGQDRYQLQPDPTADGVYRLLGAPVVVTPRLPVATGTPDTTAAVLADFSQIAVARDLAPSVKILDQTFADFDQQAIRVVARYDAAPLNAQAVVVLRGITA